jgi:hypothetical protein
MALVVRPMLRALRPLVVARLFRRRAVAAAAALLEALDRARRDLAVHEPLDRHHQRAIVVADQ